MASARSLPPSLKFVTVAFLVLWLIIAAFPFLWTVWGSFKVQADFFSRESFWNAIWGTATTAQTGGPFTGAGYYGAWITNDFWRAVLNTAIVTVCVTVISLTFGTLGGYALARSGYGLPMIYGTEVIAGLMLLIGGWKPLALLVLAPITANILAYDAMLNPSGIAIGIVIAAIHGFLLWRSRTAYRPLLECQC